MARCKLTNMNLRNIRKSREYQCLLIDLVKTGVVGKTAAEGLLGYTIPTGLLGDTTPVTPTDDDEDEPTPRNVTVIYSDAFDPLDSELGTDYESFEYDLNDGDSEADIIAAAVAEFNDNNLKVLEAVTLEPIEGKQNTIMGYNFNPVPFESIEPGMTFVVHYQGKTVDEEKPVEG